MCILNNSRAPSAPKVAPAPTRAGVSTAANELIAKAQDAVRKRTGVFGNIRTTPMGDASYGSSTINVARFG